MGSLCESVQTFGIVLFKKSTSKLSCMDVKEIRNLLRNGISQYQISKEYGVSQATISKIKMRLIHKEVI